MAGRRNHRADARRPARVRTCGTRDLIQHQGHGVVAGVSAAEGQRGLLDGVRDPCRGHVAQAGDDVAEPVLPVDVMVNMAAGLGDAVGEQHQAVTGPQQPPRVVQVGIRQDAEHGPRQPECLHAPVRAVHQGQRVAPRADLHRGPGHGRPHRGVDRGQEPRVIGGPLQQGLIQRGQDQPRPGLAVCFRSEGVSGQRGALGRRGPLAAHVADHHPPATPDRGKDVVEVPEDLGPRPSRHITRRYLKAGDDRQPRWQQALLQGLRQGGSVNAVLDGGLQRDFTRGDVG
jgi:hypothetical protein